jgi:hypothetical protein
VKALKTELTREFAVPTKAAYDYLNSFRSWPAWYAGILEILDPEKGAWKAKGDKVRFAYRLLGRRVEGVAILEEKREGELTAFHTEVSKLPNVRYEYHYESKGTAACQLRVVLQTEEPTSFFGKAIDRMVLPRVLERDLRQSLDNLQDIFASGLHL